VNNTYLNETYLPKAIAFYHCGNSAALAFARKSTAIVLRVLPILFDRELEGPQGSDQRQFTSTEVENEACVIDSSVESDAIFTGLFLAQEFSVFTGTGRDDKQVGIVSFSLGERVYETQYLDWDDHIRRSNTALVNEWEYAKRESIPNRKTASVSLESEATLIPAVDGPLAFFRDADANDSQKVFVVHGHAEEPKQAVADFLRSVSLEPIILHEQPNQGRTIIEKFEKHSDVVGFAVVLLTPDDIGASADNPTNMRPRARQNVVLELGYFMSKLGRGKVCCLYVDGVELPSDYQGVLWLPYDDTGAWRQSLAKELSAAGIEIDLRKAGTGESETIGSVMTKRIQIGQ
jgi:predicted nucleotide-binding protein